MAWFFATVMAVLLIIIVLLSAALLISLATGGKANQQSQMDHSHPEPYVLDSVRSYSPTSAPEYANEGLMFSPVSHEGGEDTQLDQDDHQQETLPGQQPTAYAMALNHPQEDDSNVYEDVEIMDG